MCPPLDRVVETVVRPHQADGVVLDGLRVRDGAVEVEHQRLDALTGQLVSASTAAATRPVEGWGRHGRDVQPVAISGLRRDRPDDNDDADGVRPAPADETQASTVDPDVKSIASADATSASCSGGGTTGTVR